METTLIERIMHVAKEKNMTLRKFSIHLDFNYNTFNNYVIGKRISIDVELLCKILYSFEDISAEWLLIGRGGMYKNKEQNINESSNNNLLMKTIIELSGKNALLEERLKKYEKQEFQTIAAEKKQEYNKKSK